MLHPSLCRACRHVREIVSGKGSRFLLCELSQTDARFAKYPPQPVGRCTGYEPRAAKGKPPDPSGSESPAS